MTTEPIQDREDQYDLSDVIPFSMTDMAVVKALMGCVETGKLGGDPGLLVVLKDRAGITFGKHQATENGGALWKLLYTYYAPKGDPTYTRQLAPYRNVLYSRRGQGRKNALTNNKAFKGILKEAAAKDPEMGKAQDLMFHMEYFRPALKIASDYDLTIPLGLLAVYDVCIQSGPVFAAQQFEKFNDDWFGGDDLDMDDSFRAWEQAWIYDWVRYRHQWLSTFSSSTPAHNEAVQNSRYRTASYLNLIERNLWNLTPPFEFVLLRSVVGKPDKYFQITEETVLNL